MAMQQNTFDVAVVGGGTAGIIAAVQAGRAGARALLIEPQGMLGGTITVAGINGISSFFAWERQVIAGIGWELVSRTYREMDVPMPTPAQCNPKSGALGTPVDRALFAALADEAVVEAGVTLLLHAMLAGLRRERDAWLLSVCTKTGLQTMRAATIVDCTGDANAATLAGYPTERGEELQPGTLAFTLGGYDVNTLDLNAIQAAFEREIAAGTILASDPGWHHGDFRIMLHAHGGNCAHVCGIDGTSSEGRTAAELEGRRVMLRVYRFARRQPGLERLTISSCPVECGIRETVRIQGKKTITVADYESGRVWDDSVCYAHYPIDIHRPVDTVWRPTARGVHPTIPLGALLPRGSTHLVVACRSVASDREAHSALRVIAPCMAMGQAAGAAAALAARQGCAIDAVPIAELRALLETHGAIVPK